MAKTKAEKELEAVVEKLEEAGIEYDKKASLEELTALLPEDEAEKEKKADKKAEPEKKSGKHTVATVTWLGRSRDYTLEIHGKDFEKLAKQFANKFNGKVTLA